MSETEHSPTGTGSHQCPLCSHTFSTRKSLSRHTETVHGPKTTVCPYDRCGKIFARRDNFIRHERTQHNEHDRKECCISCGKMIRSRSMPAHSASETCKRARLPLLLLTVSTDTSPPDCLTPVLDPQSLFEGLSWTMSEQSSSGPPEDNVWADNVAWTSSGITSRRDLILDRLDARELALRPKVIQSKAPLSPVPASSQTIHIPTPDYLPAIADPVLLSAWLFVKLKPWGPTQCWADDHWLKGSTRTYTHLPIEILRLREVVLKTIVRCLFSSHIHRDPYFADALVMMTFFICKTEGWANALTFAEALVWLAHNQVKVIDGGRKAFRNIVAVDAFQHVLHRYVKPEYIASLEDMFVTAQRVLRDSAIDTMDMDVPGHIGPVWTRVYGLGAGGWYKSYEEPLRFVRNLAVSIPYNIEKGNEVSSKL